MLLPLRGLGQVSINHAILWCKFGFHCDLELVGMLDQSISTPRATFVYTIWVMYNGTTLYSNSCVPQIAKWTPTNPNFIQWSLHLLKWVAFFLTWVSCLCIDQNLSMWHQLTYWLATKCVQGVGYIPPSIMCQLIRIFQIFLVWDVPLAFHSLPWRRP